VIDAGSATDQRLRGVGSNVGGIRLNRSHIEPSIAPIEYQLRVNYVVPRGRRIKVHHRSYELRLCRDEDKSRFLSSLLLFSYNFPSCPIPLHIHSLCVRCRTVGMSGDWFTSSMNRASVPTLCWAEGERVLVGMSRTCQAALTFNRYSSYLSTIVYHMAAL